MLLCGNKYTDTKIVFTNPWPTMYTYYATLQPDVYVLTLGISFIIKQTQVF
jgi:hypothetical protein